MVPQPSRPGARSRSRMFSAKFCSQSFPVNLYCRPSHVCNDHSQLGAFHPQGAKTPLFCPTIRYIQILCQYDVTNRHKNTILGRKHLHIAGKATIYYLGTLHNQFYNLSHCVPKMTKNRPPSDTFMSELNIYKLFEMNNMDSLPNRKLPKAISFYLVPRSPFYLENCARCG